MTRMKEVQDAYKGAAIVLIKLAEAFGKTDAPCVAIWRNLETTQELEVILPPGVVIGNYCPEGHMSAKEDAFRRRADSFPDHRRTLEGHGITIHEIGPDHLGFHLPILQPGSVKISRGLRTAE